MVITEPDPFAVFHTPPPGETAGERAAREAKEAEKERVSALIDDQLKAEKLALKKLRIVRVLLLGQSGSGKSTILKNFRMRYAKSDWDAERSSWRPVIQLNVIRSIITIVESLQAEMDGDIIEPGTPTTLCSPLPNTPVFTSTRPKSPPLGARMHSLSQPFSTLLTENHRLLMLRLGMLRRVETVLKTRLGDRAVEEAVWAGAYLGPLNLELDSAVLVKKQKVEWGVLRLHDALEKGSCRVGSMHVHGSDNGSGEGTGEATDIIASCREDMKTLWSDEVVRVVLKKRKIWMEDSAGFFLDDLDRIAQRNYEPSDDDVVRARLRTLGVQEYRISFEPPNTLFEGASNTSLEPRPFKLWPILNIGDIDGDAGEEWLLYDVGGSRTKRHAWLPYFDNVQAIIFLAPVSSFDEQLTEDSRINRLEDSFLLWRSVCGSKLLAKATMILLLNKCDLLREKLQAGTQVKKYLPSYGERPNDVNAVVKYLKEKFKDILKRQSPAQRMGYFYATTAINMDAVAATVYAVKEGILRANLNSSEIV